MLCSFIINSAARSMKYETWLVWYTISLINYAEKVEKCIPWVLKHGDSIGIKLWLGKYREESMKSAIWAMQCAEFYSNHTLLSLRLSGTLQNWIKIQE